MKKIFAAVKEHLDFPYSIEILKRPLIKIGFKYKKRGRERIYYERCDLVRWREQYLRRVKEIREKEPEREIIYLDETWITEGHQSTKERIDTKAMGNPYSFFHSELTVGCIKEHVGRGKRTIIADTISEKGPVPSVFRIYKASSTNKQSAKKIYNKKKDSSSVKTVCGRQSIKSEGVSNCETDYHDKMDHENYEKYFEENVCADVPHDSALIIDDASYHSKNTKNYPKSTWRKHGTKVNSVCLIIYCWKIIFIP